MNSSSIKTYDLFYYFISHRFDDGVQGILFLSITLQGWQAAWWKRYSNVEANNLRRQLVFPREISVLLRWSFLFPSKKIFTFVFKALHTFECFDFIQFAPNSVLVEKVLFWGQIFRNGDFDIFTRFEVPWIRKSYF